MAELIIGAVGLVALESTVRLLMTAKHEVQNLSANTALGGPLLLSSHHLASSWPRPRKLQLVARNGRNRLQAMEEECQAHQRV
jgi:hypothetical protein